MESLYPHIKHTHLLFIVISIILFNLRFWLKTARPNKPLHTALRVLPHINDSMLLFTGMMLMTIAKWSPFGASNWLGVKLLLVVGYIVIGIFAMRRPPRSSAAWICYALAMIFVGIVIYLARFKPI